MIDRELALETFNAVFDQLEESEARCARVEADAKKQVQYAANDLASIADKLGVEPEYNAVVEAIAVLKARADKSVEKWNALARQADEASSLGTRLEIVRCNYEQVQIACAAIQRELDLCKQQRADRDAFVERQFAVLRAENETLRGEVNDEIRWKATQYDRLFDYATIQESERVARAELEELAAKYDELRHPRQ